MDLLLPYLRRYVLESNAIEGLYARNSIWTRNHMAAALAVARESAVNPFHPDDIHKLLVRGTQLQPFAGKWRKCDIYVGDGRRSIRCPRPQHVPMLMAKWEDLARDYCSESSTRDAEFYADAAYLLHHYLLCIHPYVDGNGRTARLMLNSLRLYRNLPWSIIFVRARRGYYARITAFEKFIFKKQFPDVY